MRQLLKTPTDQKISAFLKNMLGCRPGNIFLYRQAFLHRSASQELGANLKINNERLEFLGDAVLDSVTADFLFRTYPTRDEGFLTEMRSKIVNRSQLNRLSRKLGLDQLIRLDQGTGENARSYMGDAFEALVGAIYLDKGYEFTRKILLERIIRHYFNLNELMEQELNFKSRIIEWAQKERKHLQFQVQDEVGNGYRKQYIVEVSIDNVPLARSQHYSIKGAEQLAAEKAWTQLFPEPAG